MKRSILLLIVCGMGCTGSSSGTERGAGQLGVADSGVIDSGGADAHFAPPLEQCDTTLSQGIAPRVEIEIRGATLSINGEESVGPATCTTEVTPSSLRLVCPGEEELSFELSEPLPSGVMQYLANDVIVRAQVRTAYGLPRAFLSIRDALDAEQLLLYYAGAPDSIPGEITPLSVAFAALDCELARSQCSVSRGAKLDLTVGGDMSVINVAGTAEQGGYLIELVGASEFEGDGTNGCAAGTGINVQYLVTKM